MQEKLITIATFSQVVEAHLSEGRPESEGIECFIADEHTITMNWLYSNTIGGIKLQVQQSDVERAIEILGEEPVSTDSMEDTVSEDDKPRCQKCNSPDVYYKKFSSLLKKTLHP
jgi:hypothetical protein